MKTFKILIAVIAFMFTSSVFAADFSDVSKDYWAYNAIQSLASCNMISGYSDNTFRPDAPVTRAEFATMMIAALQKSNIPTNISTSFTDVPANFWAAQNIQKAYQLNYVSGFPNGTFQPYENVTKVQVVAALSKVVGGKVFDINQANRLIYRYEDSKNIPQWAVMSVANALENGIIVNYPNPNQFTPNKKATRAEVAAMLFNTRNALGMTNTVTPTPVDTTPKVSKPFYDKIDISEQNNLQSEVLVKDKTATILEDSAVPVQLKTTLSTLTSKSGDAVYVKFNQDLSTKGGLPLISRGSKLEGKVIDVVSAKSNPEKTSQITVRFNYLITAEGDKYPINAVLGLDNGTITSSSMQQMIDFLDSFKQGGFGGGLLGLSGYLASKGEINLPLDTTMPVKFTYPLSIDTETGKVIAK